jgi:DNA-binding CsgD family transcriptional regulator
MRARGAGAHGRRKGDATTAYELMISPTTVRNHVSNIFTKL